MKTQPGGQSNEETDDSLRCLLHLSILLFNILSSGKRSSCLTLSAKIAYQ
jgi:hypothetical protein